MAGVWENLVFTARTILTAAKMNRLFSTVRSVRTKAAGTSAPPNPETGVDWIDTSVDGAWVWNVHDGGAWVPVMTIDNTTDTVSGGGGGGGSGGGTYWGEYLAMGRIPGTARWVGTPFGVRNALINGDFRFWRRGASFNPAANGAYTAERWCWRQTGAGAVAIQANGYTGTGTPSEPRWMQITVTTADASIASSDLYAIEQPIEGGRANMLGFGIVNAASIPQDGVVTVSGVAFTTEPGYFFVVLQNGDRTRSYVAPVLLAGLVGGEFFEAQIPVDTTISSWTEVGNDCGMRLSFVLACGSDKQAVANSWVSGDYRSTALATTFMGTVSNAIMIRDVQLERGGSSTPFDRVPVEIAEEMCNRYFVTTFQDEETPRQNSGSLLGCLFQRGDGTGRATIDWWNDMRAAPVLTTYNPFGTNANWWAVAAGASVAKDTTITGFGLSRRAALIATAGGDSNATNAYVCIHATVDAELT